MSKLNKIKEIKEQIELLKEKIIILDNQAVNISPAKSDVSVQSDREKEKLTEILDKKYKLEDKMKELEKELMDLQIYIFDKIEKLSYMEQKIILLRYFHFYPWEMISKKLNISLRNIYRKNKEVKNKI